MLSATVECQGNTSCIGMATISVARKLTGDRGYRHLVLGETAFSLVGGQTVQLRLHITKVGKKLLPRRLLFNRFRTTLLLQSLQSRRAAPLYLPH